MGYSPWRPPKRSDMTEWLVLIIQFSMLNPILGMSIVLQLNTEKISLLFNSRISDTCFLSFSPQVASEFAFLMPPVCSIFNLVCLTSSWFISVWLTLFPLNISVSILSKDHESCSGLPRSQWIHLLILIALRSTCQVLYSKWGDLVCSGKYFLAGFPSP